MIKRIERELNPEFIRLFKQKRPELYESILHDNGGKYPTLRQLESSYSEQRYKCKNISCEKSFSYLPTPGAKKAVGRQFWAFDRLYRILMRSRFISKAEFMEMFGSIGAVPLEYKWFEPTQSYDRKAMIRAYDELIGGIRGRDRNSAVVKGDAGNVLHGFIISVKNKNLKKLIKTIIFVDAVNLQIKYFCIYGETENLRSILSHRNERISVNFPYYLSKKIDLNLISTEHPQLEEKLFKSLSDKGFGSAINCGRSNAECRSLISFFLERFNRYYSRSES